MQNLHGGHKSSYTCVQRMGTSLVIMRWSRYQILKLKKKAKVWTEDKS